MDPFNLQPRVDLNPPSTSSQPSHLFVANKHAQTASKHSLGEEVQYLDPKKNIPKIKHQTSGGTVFASRKG